MARATTTLPQFQEYVWSQLPERQRERVGKEAIYDLVAVAVQEWPDETLSQSSPGDEIEREAIDGLRKNVARHMELVYGGRQDYGMIWIILLQVFLPIVIEKILEWWRKRKENRGRIRIWRRKWVNGADE